MIHYHSYDDNKLLSLLSNNDEEAFTEIYNRYWEKLVAVAYKILRNTAFTEDVVQDVFVNLWKSRHEMSIQSLENYLATAVKYAVFSKLKSISRAREFEKNNTIVQEINPQIESSLHCKRILELVSMEIEKLPKKCRIIFKYSREKNMNAKEIAGILQISPKTVENQIGKAIKQLKLATKEM